jgi:CBS domain containing-hemolysin-like protein
VGVAAAAVPARYIPERARLDQVLDFFRSGGSDLAICVGESGEITGLITIDDVIRELVASEGGGDERSSVRQTGEGRWEVSGRLSVRDWAEFFRGEDLRAGPRVSTVAGLMSHRLGRVPRAGDEVRLSNLRLRVESMRGRVVERVSVVLEGAGSMLESRA